MRHIFFLVFFLNISAACTNIYLSELNNSNFTLSQGECIYIIDSNTNISARDYRTPSTINLTAYEVTTNPITQITYVCNYDILNINMTLSHDGSYTNSNHNISIYAPKFPLINLEKNLTAPDTYTNPTYNITINALPKITNKNISLTYTSCYYNTDNNETICAPDYPKFDQNIKLECGQTKTWDSFNITVSSPDCANINKTLSFGENVTLPEYKLDVRALPKPNIDWNMKSGESQGSDTYGVFVSCNTTTEQYIEFCKTMPETELKTYWEIVNLTNYTCNNYGYRCLDYMPEYCTAEEKYGDPNSLLSCMNRVAKETIDNNSKCIDELNICNGEKTALYRAPEVISQTKEDIVNIFVGIGMVALIFFSGIFLAFRYLTKKKTEKSEGQI